MTENSTSPMERPSKPDARFVIDLFARCPVGALATHSVRHAGFPFATSVTLAYGADRAPWMLLSQLAEHRKNLEADPRCSVLLLDTSASAIEAPRLTLMGRAEQAHPSPDIQAHLLSQQPAWEPLLELGDFAFFRLDWLRARAIGGFARAGWIERQEIDAALTRLHVM